MDATTGAVIGIFSTIGVVILAVLAKFVYVGFNPAYPAGPTTETIFKFSLINWFRVLYYFLPYGLFLFGTIYDGLVRKIKFFPAGFIGLGVVLLNHSLSNFLSRSGVGSIDSDVCGIPGMSTWGSDFAPQNISFTATVLSYIAAYITNSQTDSSYTGSAWAGVFAVWFLQLIAFNWNGCDTSKRDGWTFIVFPKAEKFIPPILGLMSGLLWGGLSGYLISKYVTGDTAGVGLASEAKQSLGGPAMAPTSGTPGAGKCSSTDSDDQFVCEAYKNGELVTSTIVE